jgi:hypothetical protein
MTVIGKSTFQVNANGVTVQAQRVTWNGNNFSGSGSFMGQNFTATGVANGSKLIGKRASDSEPCAAIVVAARWFAAVSLCSVSPSPRMHALR